RGALTGHLVLSTLHTNDSVTSAIRLIDMGAAPYLVATSLRGVLAQRLVRRICENCKTEKAPSAQEQAWVRYLKPDMGETNFFTGRGCNSCNQTGYKGRIGVFEFLEMNEEMMDALRDNDTQGFVNATKANKDFVPLSHMALDYAAEGKTSLDEVFKVAEFVPEAVGQ
ncbi:MAG: ATPase, T2SS/T4P/T4SS family, partial [Pseudomonadota bacterium]|nr:ATPase, T2SS/T4P/T4SS family [Pseudomonadota bacterium]